MRFDPTTARAVDSTRCGLRPCLRRACRHPMADPAFPVPDPRAFRVVESAPTELRALYALAEASLAAESQQRADACDRELRAALAQRLRGDGAALAAALSGAPS